MLNAQVSKIWTWAEAEVEPVHTKASQEQGEQEGSQLGFPADDIFHTGRNFPNYGFYRSFQIYLPESSATASSFDSLLVLLEVVGKVKPLVVSLEGVGRVEMWEMTISTRKADDILVEMLIVECGFVPNLFLDLLSK